LTHKAKRPQPSPRDRASEQFQSLLATAHALADRAGAVILPHFRTQQAVDHKGGGLFDPVTAADRNAEAAIRERLAEVYPSHGILGEEFGAQASETEYCWVIDPIDGTRSFILGLPLLGTLIGLTRGGVPLLGVMDQPFTGERFWSGETESLFRHDGTTRTMRTRACADLSQALLATTSTDHFSGEDQQHFDALTHAVRLRPSAAVQFCLLAWDDRPRGRGPISTVRHYGPCPDRRARRHRLVEAAIQGRRAHPPRATSGCINASGQAALGLACECINA
jgi:myo-inositol-1(or 4)-monophosphatase